MTYRSIDIGNPIWGNKELSITLTSLLSCCELELTALFQDLSEAARCAIL